MSPLRTVLFAISLLAVFSLTVVCGGEPVDNGDNADNEYTQNNDTNDNGDNQQNNDNGDNDDNDDNGDNGDDGPENVSQDTIDMTTDFFGMTMNYMSGYAAADCECDYEEMGYDTEADCVDERVDDDSEIQEQVDCYGDAVAQYDQEAPDALGDLFGCAENALDDVQTCRADVDSSYGDVCSQEAQDDYADCDDQLDDDMDACEASYLTDDVDDWLDGVDSAASELGCFGGPPGNGDGDPPEECEEGEVFNPVTEECVEED